MSVRAACGGDGLEGRAEWRRDRRLQHVTHDRSSLSDSYSYFRREWATVGDTTEAEWTRSSRSDS